MFEVEAGTEEQGGWEDEVQQLLLHGRDLEAAEFVELFERFHGAGSRCR